MCAFRDILSKKTNQLKKKTYESSNMLWHLLYVCCYVFCHYEEFKNTFHIFLFHNILSVYIYRRLCYISNSPANCIYSYELFYWLYPEVNNLSHLLLSCLMKSYVSVIGGSRSSSL